MALQTLLESCRQAAGARGVVLFNSLDKEVARVGEVGGLTTCGGQIVLPSDVTCVGVRNEGAVTVGWLLLVAGDDQANLDEMTAQIAVAMAGD